MTQVTSENTQAITSSNLVSRAGGVKRLITIVLFALLMILVVFLLFKMNSLGNQLAVLQTPSSTSQIETNKVEGESPQSELNVKAVELAKYRAIAAKFTSLNSRGTQLKFAQIESAAPQKSLDLPPKKIISLSANSEMRWWSAVGDKVLTPIGNFFRDLVKIQAIDDPEMKGAANGVAISPLAQSLVKQQVLTYLLSARQFVLLEMPKEALGDLQEVRLLVLKNFAPQSPETLAFIEGLNQVESDLKQMVPSTQAVKPAEKK